MMVVTEMAGSVPLVDPWAALDTREQLAGRPRGASLGLCPEVALEASTRPRLTPTLELVAGPYLGWSQGRVKWSGQPEAHRRGTRPTPAGHGSREGAQGARPGQYATSVLRDRAPAGPLRDVAATVTPDLAQSTVALASQTATTLSSGRCPAGARAARTARADVAAATMSLPADCGIEGWGLRPSPELASCYAKSEVRYRAPQ